MSFIKKNLFSCFFEISAFGVELMTVSIKKANNKAQRNRILVVQKSIIRNVLKLYDKRTDILNSALLGLT